MDSANQEQILKCYGYANTFPKQKQKFPLLNILYFRIVSIQWSQSRLHIPRGSHEMQFLLLPLWCICCQIHDNISGRFMTTSLATITIFILSWLGEFSKIHLENNPIKIYPFKNILTWYKPLCCNCCTTCVAM